MAYPSVHRGPEHNIQGHTGRERGQVPAFLALSATADEGYIPVVWRPGLLEQVLRTKVSCLARVVIQSLRDPTLDALKVSRWLGRPLWDGTRQNLRRLGPEYVQKKCHSNMVTLRFQKEGLDFTSVWKRRGSKTYKPSLLTVGRFYSLLLDRKT